MNKTPQEYIKKVCDMFKNYGIKSVTMDDVARELGISKKTLYLHFKDKSELVGIILKREFKEKADEFSEAMENKENAIEELFEYYKVQIKILTNQKPNFLYDLKKYYSTHFDEFTKKKKERMMESVMKNLKRGKEEGLFRADINEDIVTRMHIARIDSIMTSGIFSFEELRSPLFFSEAFKYHIFAIVNDKGREIVNKKIKEIIANT